MLKYIHLIRSLRLYLKILLKIKTNKYKLLFISKQN